MDMHVHDTYFVIAHFHFIMVGGMVMAYMGGLHYWWPKITGRMYSEWWSQLAAIIIFVGFFLTFLPQFVVGYNGMPRRYHRYRAGVPGLERDVDGGRVDPGGRLRAAAVLPASTRCGTASRPGRIPGRRPAWSGRRRRRRRATTSPRRPIVVRGPYEYHVEKAQNEP